MAGTIEVYIPHPHPPKTQYNSGELWYQTPRNSFKKPFKKPFTKQHHNPHNTEREYRDNRGPPYQQDQYRGPPSQHYRRTKRSPIPVYNRFEPIRHYNDPYPHYQQNQYEQTTQRLFLGRERREY